ncbi:inner membrane transporter RhtA [Arthrobacter sp. cf158]|uniref:EamA family transporter n=1 Tax=Arthrobacter sp. cf158 TaxID=1761744 RepID=UPI0008946A29|nr:EamA family transporter [Arthrobacter sp. cf158]SDX23524.1 inner membrane transporter RhtA [Arthrobacter sp. cf158]
MSTANRGPVPPWGLAVAAMISVQLSSALSVGLIAEVGPAGTAWLRLSMGAIIFLAIARPPLRSVRRHDVLPLLGLGVATGLMTIMFLGAVERIPLGTTVAIEFLGPLTVAAVRSHNRRALAWPLLALLGVVLLTEPWHGQVDLLGVMFAAIAAAGWGAYILLTQKIGDRFTGIGALSLTVPIAAVTAAVVGIPQAVGHLDLRILSGALGVAVLMPVLPFVLELKALRRMTSTAFGTLMSLEPAFGVLLGLLVLHQQPSLVQFLGIALVVFAGAASQRGGTRNAPPLAEPTTLGPAPEVASSTSPTKEA